MSKKNKLNFSWGEVVGVLLGIFAIFGGGYATEDYKSQIDCKYEMIRLQQEYNEKIQSRIDECRDLKMREFDQSKLELEKLVEGLKKASHGK